MSSYSIALFIVVYNHNARICSVLKCQTVTLLILTLFFKKLLFIERSLNSIQICFALISQIQSLYLLYCCFFFFYCLLIDNGILIYNVSLNLATLQKAPHDPMLSQVYGLSVERRQQTSLGR